MKTTTMLRGLWESAFILMLVSLPALTRGMTAPPPAGTVYLPDQVIVYSEWGNSREIYTYNGCHNLVSLLKQTPSGDDWADAELTNWTYDENGNIQTKYFSYVQWGSSETHTYDYDCHGNILREYIEYSGSSFADLYTYEYDCHGYLIKKMTQYSQEPGVWINSGYIAYSYGPVGKLLTETSYIWIDPDWVGFDMYTYTYDVNGNLLSRMDQYWASWEIPSSWKNAGLDIYTYDASGKMLTLVNQVWGDQENAWVNYQRSVYSYTGDGNCSRSVVQFWNGDPATWADYSESLYEYTAGLVTGHSFQWNGTEWVSASSEMELAINPSGKKTVFFSGYALDAYAYYTGTAKLAISVTPDQTVYYGYAPAACATVGVTVAGGTAPYTYQWDSGNTTQSFQACPAATTTYTVKVTDANGCVASACAKVFVVDVRCGNKLDKVAVCHCTTGNNARCETKCVTVSAAAGHLAHGDHLGACEFVPECGALKSGSAAEAFADEDEDASFISASPNPASGATVISYRVNNSGKISIRLISTNGQTGKTLFEGFAGNENTHTLEASLESLRPGMYILVLMQADGTVIHQKLILQQ
jgi:hypothetical protein